MKKLLIIPFVFLLVCCTKEQHALTFIFDGKRQVFDHIEATTYLNCGVREWQVKVLDGERFFKINWQAGTAWFWYTYRGHSVAYAGDPFRVHAEQRGDVVQATFGGGIVRDGIVKTKFIER